MQEEIAKTIEEENRKKRRPGWTRNPEWWTVIVSVFQFLVITVALGAGGWYVSKKAKADAVRREVATRCTHLEEAAPDSYRPATEALINLGPDGIQAVLNYAKNGSCTRTNRADCAVPWRKARFLHKQITSVATNDEDRKRAGELISSSWMCHDYDPGLDMEFYEILKAESNVTCPIALSHLEKLDTYPYRADRVVSAAALLTLLEKACPGRSSPQLETLRSNFESKLKSEIAEYWELIEVNATFYVPWRQHRPSDATAGPFEATDVTWRHMTMDIFNVFAKHGRVATGVMWHRLEDESLATRLIFGQLVLYFERETPMDKDSKPQFERLVEAGLVPTADSESKVAAISAIANLNLKNHKASLQRVANSDEDPSIRKLARSALDFTFSSRVYHPPVETALQP